MRKLEHKRKKKDSFLEWTKLILKTKGEGSTPSVFSTDFALLEWAIGVPGQLLMKLYKPCFSWGGHFQESQSHLVLGQRSSHIHLLLLQSQTVCNISQLDKSLTKWTGKFTQNLASDLSLFSDGSALPCLASMTASCQREKEIPCRAWSSNLEPNSQVLKIQYRSESSLSFSILVSEWKGQEL